MDVLKASKEIAFDAWNDTNFFDRLIWRRE